MPSKLVQGCIAQVTEFDLYITSEIFYLQKSKMCAYALSSQFLREVGVAQFAPWH